jgi:hypothetical protein
VRAAAARTTPARNGSLAVRGDARPQDAALAVTFEHGLALFLLVRHWEDPFD